MATIVEPSKGKAPQIDDGLHPVICRGVKSVTVDNDQFGNFEKIEIAIEFEGMTDEDGDPLTLDPRCNRKWNEKATLYQWATAFGVVANINDAFDADELIGKRAMALIETKEEGDWPRVTKFTPIKKGAATKPDASKAPSLINYMGEPDWPKFWAEADKLAGDRDKAKELVLSLINGDLKNLEGMEATTVVDLFEAMKEKVAVPF